MFSNHEIFMQKVYFGEYNFRNRIKGKEPLWMVTFLFIEHLLKPYDIFRETNYDFDTDFGFYKMPFEAKYQNFYSSTPVSNFNSIYTIVFKLFKTEFESCPIIVGIEIWSGSSQFVLFFKL